MKFIPMWKLWLDINIIWTEITCQGLQDGKNTEPVPDALRHCMPYLQSYTYSCTDGFYTEDEICVFCRPDGSLSAPPPNCEGELNLCYG